jgi:cardiolipin synthase
MSWQEARWPLGIATVLGGWYASDSLRHRREHGATGYELHGNADLDVGEAEFMRAAEVLTGAAISTGDEVELLINGDEIFPAFLETIRGAQQTLNLLTYAYWRGEICDEMADCLVARAQDGVEVNVLLDAIGTLQMERGTTRKLEEGGVRVARFRPLKPYAIRRAANRTHRKILVADGSIGMIGGVGIAEEWTGNAQDPDHWRDTHVRVRGPIVRGPAGRLRRELARGHRRGARRPAPPARPRPGRRRRADAGRALERRRGRHRGRGALLPRARVGQALDRADRRVLRAAPGVHRGAVRRRPPRRRRRVLVPGPHIDKEFVRIAGRASYEELHACGVRIWEYQPTMLHAKTLVIDGAWSSVGSVNFDNRSFQLHDEATLCVQSRRFADRLHRQFERDLEVSAEMDADRWRERPRFQRAQEGALRLVRREL